MFIHCIDVSFVLQQLIPTARQTEETEGTVSPKGEMGGEAYKEGRVHMLSPVML